MSFVEIPVLWDNRDEEEDFSLEKTKPDLIHVNPSLIFSISDSPDAPGYSVITDPSGTGYLIPLTTSEVVAKLIEKREE